MPDFGNGAWTSLCDTNQHVFRPGDGDVYVVSCRVLVGDEARFYNATEGDLMVRTWYEDRVLQVPLALTGQLAFSYVREKARRQGFGDGFARHAITFHKVAAVLTGREAIFEPLTPERMGWRTDWRDELEGVLEDIAATRRDMRSVA